MTGLAQSGLHNLTALAWLFPLQPPSASTISESVDQLYFILTGITLFFTVLIFSIIFYFMVKYRRRPGNEIPPETHAPLVLELAWTIIPSIICVFLFVATAEVYVRNSRPPASSTEIFVIGKQWMWHLQHAEGPREINELHVPVGVPIKLTMTSQDVIHDFYIPAFRVKKDVVPGRYSSIWFQATEVGTYHLFCAQYCGTNHSNMIGWIYVMSPADYAAWLAGGEKSESMAQQGERLFTQLDCATCHTNDTKGLGPSLAGVYGKPEKLQSGEVRTVDETLIREAILTPNSVLIPGFAPVMPTYKGQMDEEQMLQLIAYVKSLGSSERTPEMSTAIADLHEAPVEPPVNYLNATYGIKSWLLTFDHKRIGLLYLGTISFMFLVGGTAATLMRLHLIEPQGSLFEPETYNKLFSTHGIIMVFFFLVPSIPATLGNFLIPLMIGARDVAFPKLNLMSWYIFVIGCLFALTAVVSGGVDTGWTFYPPYSSLYSHTPVVVMALGVFIAGFSSILTGLNFIVTIHKMRAPGMTWFRLPLFIWAMYATSIIFVLGTPVIAITVFLLGLERLFHVGIFDPALGGDPLLFQHMFWFYSHPAVYIMILPSMGVVSELITAFSRKKIFGYSFVAFSSLAIAIISFVVWGHHMFVTGQSIYAGLVFSALSFLVAIPSAVKVFNWTATLYKGSISYEAPMLYALGFIGLFTMGGLTGLFLASLSVDVHLNGTYFVVAHFHYVMVGGALMGYLGGLHFWWPKITGRLYPDMWARIAAGIVFIGFNLTFFPQFVLGYLGMPRRYAVYPAEFQVLNVMSSMGASILAVGYIIPLVYLTWSMRYGPPAGPNPWGAKGLEWTTSSPPPTENFEVMPVVTEDAYEYPVLGGTKHGGGSHV